MSVSENLNSGRKKLDGLEAVVAPINFSRRSPAEDAPSADISPGYDFPKVTYDVTIYNARPIIDKFSLDEEGFILVNHKLDCVNERDPDTLRAQYISEMRDYLQQRFAPSWIQTVDMGGALIRSIGATTFLKSEAPSKFSIRHGGSNHAHIDYAPVASPMLAALDCQLKGEEIRPYSRLLIIQTWQAISPPPQSVPLAFCDGSTIAKADIFETYFRSHGVSHLSRALHHNPDQVWYYLPDLTNEEFYLFKGYDSDDHYHHWAGHTSFDNTKAYPNAVSRESVESRFYLYYE